MKMKTEALIRELAGRAEPVKPVDRPSSSVAVWTAAALVWISASVAAVGLRTDLAAVSRAPAFAWDLGGPLALGIASSMAAFAAGVPGPHGRRWALIAAGALGTWLLVVAGGTLAHPGHVGTGVKCLRNLVVFSVPPGLLLHLMLRRAAPLDCGTAGMLAAIATSALAHVGTRFVCHNDGALHVLVWHCSFVLALGGVGMLVGRALLRRLP
jgi:hypothetical protein